jgi:serine phosphatase RsbU (regulator of sigma subunit)
VVYTDGISEARNPKAEEFGLDNLQALVEADPNLTSDAFADRVLVKVKDWTARSPAQGHDDDITLLTIRVNQGGAAS